MHIILLFLIHGIHELFSRFWYGIKGLVNRRHSLGIGVLFGVIGLLVIPQPIFATYQASDLLGQLDADNNPNFSGNIVNNGAGGDNPNNKGFQITQKVALDLVHHRLFQCDLGNNRILVFNLDENNNLIDRLPDNVIGHDSYTVRTPGTTSILMDNPRGIAYDAVHDRLFVADSANHRVLIFDTTTIIDGEEAVNVLGQSNLNQKVIQSPSTQNSIAWPYDASYDEENDWLYVLSATEDRVLVFDVDPGVLTNGENAMYVIGQQNFTSVSNTVERNRLFSPHGLLYESKNKRLFVADYYAHRVLVFDTSTITNGEDATHVLGQTDFTSSLAQSTRNGMYGPFYFAYDSENERMFISDSFSNSPPDLWNNRVLIFDVNPATMQNGENAISVIGQPDFTSFAINIGGSTSSYGLYDPRGIAFDPGNNRLYVPEKSNARTTIFNFVRITNDSLGDGTINQSYSTNLNAASYQGTVSYAITSGSLPPGLVLSGSQVTGTPTTLGNYSFTAQATDTLSVGTFLSKRKNFTININQPSSNNAGSSDPNSRSGWAYKIMAGSNHVGSDNFISSSDGSSKAMAYISKTAHHDDVYVSIDQRSTNFLAAQPKPILFPWQQGFNAVSEIYDFKSYSAFNGYPIPTFDNPVTVVLPYDPTKLRGISPQRLRIAWWDSTSKRWTTIKNNTVIDIINHTVANTTKKFSYFAVVYVK